MSRLIDQSAVYFTSDRWRTLWISIIVIVPACIGIRMLLSTQQPFPNLATSMGLVLVPITIVSPKWGLIAFLWLAHTVDGLKRILYSFENFSQEELAQILIVPLIVACALYLRVIILNWFGSYLIPRVQLLKFWPILLAGAAGGGLILKGGLNFSSMVANYPLVCYIPAGIVMPYLLFNPFRQQQFGKTILSILLVIGGYGLVQAVHGPFQYEITYLRSGLTMIGAGAEEGYFFRAFSLLNNSSTLSGVMVMGTFFSFVYLCRDDGRLRPRRSVLALSFFTIVICIAAAQRGSLICFLLTLALIPFFTRPKLFLLTCLCGLVFFAGLIYFAVAIKDMMYEWNDVLVAGAGNNDLLLQNANILTLGQRLDGFADLSNPALWTPFGAAKQIGDSLTGSHDLISNFLEWFGFVGTGGFLIFAITITYFSISKMAALKEQPQILLWAQVNLAVFLFMLIWGFLLGPSMHVSPMNLYFWTSIGNLIFIYRGLVRVEASVLDEFPSPFSPAASSVRGGVFSPSR